MKRPSHLLRAASASLGLVLALGLAPVANADEETQSLNAESGALQYGPDPTQSSIEARRGSYSVGQEKVNGLSTDGFGSATIWYPTNGGRDEKYGVVAVSPGFTAGEATISWLGPRIASRGFVVITINTQTRLDQPYQRGQQLLSALDHVQNKAGAQVQAVADHSRQAVVGHSMGGGGTLEAARKRKSIKATVGLTPWNLNPLWSDITSPSLIIGSQNDLIAPHQLHAEPFYASLPNSTPKAYLELFAAGHLAPNMENDTIGWSTVAWLKTYVDGDQRYKQFICPGPNTGLKVGKYKTNCDKL